MNTEQQGQLFTATLRGEVTRIVYENGEGSYTVLRLLDADGGGEKTAVGAFGGIGVGQHLELTGRWEKHPDFGAQFRAARFRPILPSTPEGLVRFLGSGAIPGIGKKTARLIVDHFGAETIDVLDHHPRQLTEVPGIGPHKAEAILAAWRESASRRDVFIYLQGLGITPTYCQKLFRRYAEKAADVVRANPYRLAEEIDGIGFLKADEIAAGLGIARNSPERLTAAAVYEMNQLSGNGHVCCPEEEFVRRVAELTGQVSDLVSAAVARAIARHLLIRLDGMLYAPQLARAEQELPALLRKLADAEDFAGRRCRPLPTPSRIVFNAEQQAAVDAVCRAPVTIITGGPGVGKTTVIGEIVRRAKAAGLKIAAAAPTGRAARRLGESTGISAKTLHRLLVFDPQSGRFGYDQATPLNCDLLIVDEVSMLDLLLALALFRAVRPGTSVVLVGDRDQLPSVGPGTVLASLIHSGVFPVISLVRVFRQAEGSRIIVNAHRVNHGELPEKPRPDAPLADFYWIEQDDPERALDLIEKLAVERIPARFRLDPIDDIQVLTPMNRGTCGTLSINQRLQAALNPDDKPQFQFGDRKFKSGDKVMQTSNNYDKLVYNGDLGRIQRIDAGKKKLQVLFEPGRLVEYAFDEADQIAAAYAITVHKSQGSEFPAVILPMLTQHYLMLQRNLLYTAMTRARRLLVLIGSRAAIELAVNNRRIAPRYTRLTERIAADFKSGSIRTPDGPARA